MNKFIWLEVVILINAIPSDDNLHAIKKLEVMGVERSSIIFSLIFELTSNYIQSLPLPFGDFIATTKYYKQQKYCIN